MEQLREKKELRARGFRIWDDSLYPPYFGSPEDKREVKCLYCHKPLGKAIASRIKYYDSKEPELLHRACLNNLIRETKP